MDVNVWPQRRLSTKELSFWTVVLEKTLESPWDCKEIKPGNPKRNQFWIFIWRTDAEAEAPVFWTPDEKNWLLGKRTWYWKRLITGGEGTSGNEMVGWHDWQNGHDFEQTLGVGDGQGSLACCSPWGCKESDTTKRLSWVNLLSNKGRLLCWSRMFKKYKKCQATVFLCIFRTYLPAYCHNRNFHVAHGRACDFH